MAVDASPTTAPAETADALKPRWMRPLAITVDGPAGSGKSTIAQRLADRLGFQYLDTGGTYRAAALACCEASIDLDDAEAVAAAVAQCRIELPFLDGRWAVVLNGRDVSDRIRKPDIDEASSKIARHEPVRVQLVELQRQQSLVRDTVLDGRDCGTRVRPDADLSLLITADVTERARRRAAQSGAAEAAAVERAMVERDERDAPQSVASPTAITIDTTNIGIGETLDQATALWIERRRSLLDAERVAGRTAREWIDVDVATNFRTWMRYSRWFWRRFFRLEAHGVERIPQCNCVFVANHASMWDSAFIMVAADRPIRYMAKVEATTMPVFGSIASSVGAFPVRRGGGDRVAIHIGEEVLQRGDSLGIFPEGTRIYDDRLGRPRRGAVRLALVTGVPIVPVAIHGSRYSESAFKVTLAFGAPIETASLTATPEQIEATMDETWDAVQQLWLALRRASR